MTEKQRILKEKQDILWKNKLEALITFLQTHTVKEINIKTTQTIGNETISIGPWFYQQRKLYNKKALNPERKKELENVVSGMFENIYYSWEKSFKIYKTVFEKGIDINYSTTYGRDNYKVGQWVKNQKKFYKDNNPQLSQRQIKKIEKVNKDFFENIIPNSK